MGCGGNQLISFGPQGLKAVDSVRVASGAHPTLAAHRDVFVGQKAVVQLDEVKILEAKGIARTDHGAGVMGLKDILEDHGEVAGTLLKNFMKTSYFVLAKPLATQMSHQCCVVGLLHVVFVTPWGDLPLRPGPSHGQGLRPGDGYVHTKQSDLDEWRTRSLR